MLYSCHYYPDPYKKSNIFFQAESDEIEPLFPTDQLRHDQDDLELNQAKVASKKQPFHIFQAVRSSQPRARSENSKGFHSLDNAPRTSLPTVEGTGQSSRVASDSKSSKSSSGFHAPLLTVPTRNPEKVTKRTQEVSLVS